MTELAENAGLAFVGRPICTNFTAAEAPLRQRLAELTRSTRYSFARELAA